VSTETFAELFNADAVDRFVAVLMDFLHFYCTSSYASAVLGVIILSVRVSV